KQIDDRTPMVAQAEKVTAEATSVERWLATDVTWLDGLETLSRRLRPEPQSSKGFSASTDIVATQLTMYRPPANDPVAGRIDLKAVAKNEAAFAALEHRLRDERHQVAPGNLKQDSSLPGYGTSFDLNVGVVPPPAGEVER
ncbi:MAG: hypothetical protein ACT4O2_08615, partial [Beijerinckiaceae bacterium]